MQSRINRIETTVHSLWKIAECAVKTSGPRNESFIYRPYDLCAVEIKRNIYCTVCVLIKLKNLCFDVGMCINMVRACPHRYLLKKLKYCYLKLLLLFLNDINLQKLLAKQKFLGRSNVYTYWCGKNTFFDNTAG